MKHHPSILAEAWVFGIHGNQSLRAVSIQAQLLADLLKGWVTNFPRWLRTKWVISCQTFSLNLGKFQENQDKLILSPQLNPGLSSF